MRTPEQLSLAVIVAVILLIAAGRLRAGRGTMPAWSHSTGSLTVAVLGVPLLRRGPFGASVYSVSVDGALNGIRLGMYLCAGCVRAREPLMCIWERLLEAAA